MHYFIFCTLIFLRNQGRLCHCFLSSKSERNINILIISMNSKWWTNNILFPAKVCFRHSCHFHVLCLFYPVNQLSQRRDVCTLINPQLSRCRWRCKFSGMKPRAPITRFHTFHTLLYSQFWAVIIIIIIIMIIIIRALSQDFMNAAPKSLSLSYDAS